jgi:histidinol-phosphate aminotransferase
VTAQDPLSPLARPHLARLMPYVPGKPLEELARELGITDAVKLASNENPIGPSPRALAAARDALAEMNRYPDAASHALRERLAHKLGVRPDELAFGNGSNELIDLLCRAFAGPSDHGVIGTPTFVCYASSLACAEVPTTEVPLDEGLYWNPERLLAAVTPRTRLLFVDNPNNPTSTHLGRDALVSLLRRLPQHVIAVLDEAYAEFADAADYASGLSLRAHHPHVVVLRTFSKAYGLAGLRVGYAVGPAPLMSALQRVRAPFNVSLPAQAAALAALDDETHLHHTLEHNRVERARLVAGLERLGLRVAPSQTNFVCVGLGREAGPVYEALLRAGVIVRVLGVMPQHLRISVGLVHENDRLLVALEKLR